MNDEQKRTVLVRVVDSIRESGWDNESKEFAIEAVGTLLEQFTGPPITGELHMELPEPGMSLALAWDAMTKGL